MNEKSLKEKRVRVISIPFGLPIPLEYPSKDGNYVKYSDIEKTVKKLFEEIDERINEIREWLSAKRDSIKIFGVKDGWEYLNALKWVKGRIKKHFGVGE